MITTSRLILRQWKPEDTLAFIDLNSDPTVMEYFLSTWDAEETESFINTCSQLIASRGGGFWAVEKKFSSEFIGMVGLNNVPDDLPIKQSVEVGWRLAKKEWGNGYATEAASASLNYAFNTLKVKEVVAFTPVQNRRSRRVMKKLNMTELKETFAHPRVPVESGLSEHALYEITSQEYNS